MSACESEVAAIVVSRVNSGPISLGLRPKLLAGPDVSAYMCVNSVETLRANDDVVDRNNQDEQPQEDLHYH